MQRPAELVPITEYLLGTSLVPPEGFGKALHLGKIPKKIGQHLAKIQQNLNSAKFWQNLRMLRFSKNSSKV